MNLHINHIEKVCNFYVSDWHMAVMIVPYINQEINSGKKVATIFENTIQENIEILLEKLHLKNEHEIKNMHWESKPQLKIKDIQEIIEGTSQDIVFIINGSETYIKQCAKKIIQYCRENQIQKHIKIVNCFSMNSIDGNVTTVLEQHSKMLHTKGETELTDLAKEKTQHA